MPIKTENAGQPTGELDALTIEQAREMYGANRGEQVFAAVARAGGFYDPAVEVNYLQPLDLKGLRLAATDAKASEERRKVSQDALDRVTAVLGAARKEA